MRTYTAKVCQCWSSYPNGCYKKRDQWKCIDDYELVSDKKVGRKKTKCVLKERKNETNS